MSRNFIYFVGSIAFMVVISLMFETVRYQSYLFAKYEINIPAPANKMAVYLQCEYEVSVSVSVELKSEFAK